MQIFEEYLKLRNPLATEMIYDATDLIDFIRSIPEISCLVQNNKTGQFAPQQRNWIIEQVYKFLRSEADQRSN